MNFYNAEIPSDLISAAIFGRLIIFAGAGVSMQDPVCLPSFNHLVDRIKDAVDPCGRIRPRRCEESQDRDGKVYTESPEQYLSYLDRETGIVREECCTILSSEGRTSELHRNLLRLFPEPGSVKIVTTNFDECFEVALGEIEKNKEKNKEKNTKTEKVYSSPALPYGDDFSGLVYLHGSIREPSSMVLLAEDYGKAYVTKGWASRFLVDLFEKYHVLFIGYGCGDSPVDYLTRSISGRIAGNAYALCRAGEDSSDWRVRGVTPISFQEYEDLPRIIGEWADYLKQSVTDRAHRLRDIAQRGELDNVDAEYLMSSLEWPDEGDRVVFTHEFCVASTSFEHLNLLNERGRTGFLTCLEPDDAELELLRWTVSCFSVERCAELRALCRSMPEDPSPQFFDELVRHLVLSDAPSRVVGAWIAWLELMPARYHSRCSYFLLELAGRCDVPEIVLAIIRMLLHVGLSASKDAFSNYSHEVVVAVNDEYYGDKLLNCLRAHKETIGGEVFDYCFQQIEIAYSLQTDSWTNPDVFDGLSYGRASIEPHSQNAYSRGAVNILLEMARESVTPGSVDGAIRKCLASRCTLLIRLGLWLTNEHRCTGDKLRMLQEGDYLSNLYLHHEVFQLIRSCFAVATDEQEDAFADYLECFFSSKEDSDYECFNVCNWILETSDCGKIDRMRERVLVANPNYRPREHSDFTHYMTVGSVDHSSCCKMDRDLFNVEEMVKRLSQPVEPGSFITPFDIVSVPCGDYPERAFEMIRELLAKERTQEETRLCNLLVETVDWSSECITARDAGKLLADICGQPDLCTKGINAVDRSTSSSDRKVAWSELDLAAVLSSASTNTNELLKAPFPVESCDDTDWLQVGFNHPAGEYLLLIAALDRISLVEFGRHSGTAKNLLLQLDPISLGESVGAKAVVACYFENINLWSELDEDYARKSVALLSDGGWSLIPAWQGMSCLRSLSPTVWELTKDRWKRLLSGKIGIGDDMLDKLAHLYVWIAIVRQKSVEEKIRMLESCGLGTRRAFESACHQVDNWLGSIENEDRLAAWNGWLSEAFRLIASRTDYGGDVLATMYCRWLRVFPILRRGIGEVLERDCARVKGWGMFAHEGTLTSISLDDSLTPSEAAFIISFLLERSPRPVSEKDAREAARNIKYSALSSGERRRLEDAYTRAGKLDIFEAARQCQS